MPLQPPNFFGSVDPLNPQGSDSRTISDDYHRMILASLKQQCPNWTEVVNATHGDVNLVSGLAAAGAKLLTGQAGVTTMFFYGDTAPVGWTVEEPDANIRELVIGPAVGGGITGGTIDPTNLTQTLSVSISGNVGVGGGIPGGVSFSATTGTPGQGDENCLNGVGASVAKQAHTHGVSGNTAAIPDHLHDAGSLAGSGDVAITPRFARGILGKLDA